MHFFPRSSHPLRRLCYPALPLIVWWEFGHVQMLPFACVSCFSGCFGHVVFRVRKIISQMFKALTRTSAESKRITSP